MVERDATILIVGGGICGLTTAIALERYGFEPTVYEAASTYRPVGAGIGLQGNAMRVLDRLGLADRVRSAGVTLDTGGVYTPDGRRLFGLVDSEDGTIAPVTIHRAALQRVLLEELDTTVETDMECVAVPRTGPPVAQFADGPTITPDVLVGADGIGSTVRTAVAPDVSRRPIDAVAYRAVVSADHDPADTMRGLEVWGPGTFTGRAPVDDSRFYWYATGPRSLTGDATTDEGQVAALHRRFSDYPDPISTVVDRLDPADLFVTDLADIPSLDRWTRGSVALAGDAAHGMLPFLGQGAAQGIEDALALAAALATYDDPPAALEAYEAERKPRAEWIRDESRRLGRISTISSPLGCRLRNLAAALVPAPLVDRHRRRVTDPPLPADSFPRTDDVATPDPRPTTR
ncbi:FAD-dependent monooxygenase [Halorientalis halophila]|uniref:FAD-dependent monooxygenase n=1 Tax=Halorientalis halophila TaxID=3108499 RepID=UPI003008785B